MYPKQVANMADWKEAHKLILKLTILNDEYTLDDRDHDLPSYSHLYICSWYSNTDSDIVGGVWVGNYLTCIFLEVGNPIKS